MTEVSAGSSFSKTDTELKAIPGDSIADVTGRHNLWQEPDSSGVSARQIHSSSSVFKMEKIINRVRHRSLQQSESQKHLVAEFSGSNSRNMRHMGNVEESALGSSKSAQSSYNCRGDSMNSKCSGRRESERWQHGQWGGEEWETERFPSKNAGVCRCMAGAVADLTVVCCCPLSLLHLLALAFIKLPSIVLIRTLRRVKAKIQKKRKCHEVQKDNVDPIAPFTPSHSHRESLDENPWTYSSGFADPELWQEYFGDNGAAEITFQ